jgi:hypothetical protein
MEGAATKKELSLEAMPVRRIADFKRRTSDLKFEDIRLRADHHSSSSGSLQFVY